MALDVAASSVVKWSQRLRETGSCAPAGTGGQIYVLAVPSNHSLRFLEEWALV